MQSNYIKFKSVEPFELSVSHITGVIKEQPKSHIHDKCEIYINLSGNVSFMVEGQLYPIKHGSIIITRPFEYHHCIYHDFSEHEHFWILFSSTGNEPFLDVFFNRPAGKNNLINLSDDSTEALLDICRTLADRQNMPPLEYYRCFFNLISLLCMSEPEKNHSKNLPPELQSALKFINNNFSAAISIEKLAQSSFVSINTLERMFKKHLGVTPTEYIRKKRLSQSAKLLRLGFSVSHVAAECGFSDVSQFISLFKKEFSKTPHQYKKDCIF